MPKPTMGGTIPRQVVPEWYTKAGLAYVEVSKTVPFHFSTVSFKFLFVVLP